MKPILVIVSQLSNWPSAIVSMQTKLWDFLKKSHFTAFSHQKTAIHSFLLEQIFLRRKSGRHFYAGGNFLWPFLATNRPRYSENKKYNVQAYTINIFVQAI